MRLDNLSSSEYNPLCYHYLTDTKDNVSEHLEEEARHRDMKMKKKSAKSA